MSLLKDFLNILDSKGYGVTNCYDRADVKIMPLIRVVLTTQFCCNVKQVISRFISRFYVIVFFIFIFVDIKSHLYIVISHLCTNRLSLKDSRSTSININLSL